MTLAGPIMIVVGPVLGLLAPGLLRLVGVHESPEHRRGQQPLEQQNNDGWGP